MGDMVDNVQEMGDRIQVHSYFHTDVKEMVASVPVTEEVASVAAGEPTPSPPHAPRTHIHTGASVHVTQPVLRLPRRD